MSLLSVAGAILGFFNGVAYGGAKIQSGGDFSPREKSCAPTQVGWQKKSTAQVSGQLISLFIYNFFIIIYKTILVLNFFHDIRRCLCACLVNFCKNCSCSHDLSAADRWLLVWSSLALSGWFWPVLPGSGLLICWPTNFRAGLLAPAGWIGFDLHCTSLHFIYLSLTWFLLEETLNVLLLCLTLSPFNFTQNSVKQKKLT